MGQILSKQIQDIKNDLAHLSNPNIAFHSQLFFKTGKGEYGEGDIFLGIRVPIIRSLVKKNRSLTLNNVLILIKSKYHEERLLAILILVELYQNKKYDQKKAIYDIYLENTKYINNWDLVDCSAHKILGPWLESRKRDKLYLLAKSENLWERRIAIISCFHFIRRNDFEDTLALSEHLLSDTHDLMHKAVGWMLREIGNRNLGIECEFLDTFYKRMPRTMLRYAIERFPEKLRLKYLNMKR